MKRVLIIVAALVVIAAGSGGIPKGTAQASEPQTVIGPVRHIVLPTRKDTLPFSDAVLVGNTLYLAGKIGIDPETGKPPAELEKEIRLLLDGVKATLKEAKMTMDDLVSVQIFCPDLSLYKSSTRSIAPILPRIFQPALSSDPARSCVEDASKCKGSLSGVSSAAPSELFAVNILIRC